MKLIPQLDRVIVKREKLQSSTIHIPDEVDKKERPARGTVVAVGPTCGYIDDDTREIIQPIKVGARVVFGRHAGTSLDIEGEEVWIVGDRDILCEVVE